MVGTWKGHYKYHNQKARQITGFDQTNFTILIHSFDGKHFRGTVTDDLNSGGMEGEGQITGEMNNIKISFRKLMPRRTVLFKDGKKVLDRKHPTLYYTGTISQDKKKVVGNWKIKWQIFFLFGIIPFPFKPTTGTWEMNLQ